MLTPRCEGWRYLRAPVSSPSCPLHCATHRGYATPLLIGFTARQPSSTIIGGMQLELSDEERTALLALLTRTIENDRYPLFAVENF